MYTNIILTCSLLPLQFIMFGIKQTTVNKYADRPSKQRKREHKSDIYIYPTIDSYTDKFIFFLLWKEGFQPNPTYIASPSPGADLTRPKDVPLSQFHSHFVKCGMAGCTHVIYQSKTTVYGNAVKHVRKCVGDAELAKKVYHMKLELEESKPTAKATKQKSLFDTLAYFTPQDLALFTWVNLVVIHDIAMSKCKDATFCRLLNCEPIGYDTLLATMLHLSYMTEEKIMQMMNGEKGCITHDGWSRYGHHFFCLMAILAQYDDKLQKIVPVHYMLGCSTLPNLDAGDDDDGNKCTLYCMYCCNQNSLITIVIYLSTSSPCRTRVCN